jgi:hypothetical protein
MAHFVFKKPILLGDFSEEVPTFAPLLEDFVYAALFLLAHPKSPLLFHPQMIFFPCHSISLHPASRLSCLEKVLWPCQSA